MAEEAVGRLMQEAREAGAHALILREMSLHGAAIKAFTEILRRDGLRPRVLHRICAPASMQPATPNHCCTMRSAERS